MAAKKPVATKDRNYLAVFDDVTELLEASRAASARSINALMTATYWLVGRRIFEGEQQGKGRADYGAQMIRRLAGDLSARFGRGFGRANLFQMRAFFLAYREIVQTAPGQSGGVKKVRTASGQLAQAEARTTGLRCSREARRWRMTSRLRMPSRAPSFSSSSTSRTNILRTILRRRSSRSSRRSFCEHAAAHGLGRSLRSVSPPQRSGSSRHTIPFKPNRRTASSKHSLPMSTVV